jgi:hypothetical protein
LVGVDAQSRRRYDDVPCRGRPEHTTSYLMSTIRQA